MKNKFIAIATSFVVVIAVMAPSTLSYAAANDTTSMSANNYKSEIQKIDQLINQDEDSDKDTLTYMQDAVGQDDMMKLINDYKCSYAQDEAYEMLKENLESTYEEVERNNFSEEQAKALVISATNLETGNAENSEMVFSPEIPDYAPSHCEDIESNDTLKNQYNMSVKSSTDRSSRTSYETGGIGYEVKSDLGYNKTTTFLNAGSCNITAPKNKAGYMFYTIYYNGKYQDVGIAYIGGKWQAFVSGDWTGWGTGKVSIKSGDRLYFKLWIGKGNKIYFQILDGNNFNNVLFQNSYSTSNEIPSTGKGVGFNRQITLVDTAHNATSGLYLKNAKFDGSNLYNSSFTGEFDNSNTNSKRRGKFGCSWASDDKVSIVKNSHWSSEIISIKMK